MSNPIEVQPVPESVPASLKKKRVLLIDGSMVSRDLRAEVMRKLGIDVDCASDIGEARSWWRADLYNLVLLSVENGSGHRDQFCEDIRGATPPQQLAFLVGKPDFLAHAPSAAAVSSGDLHSDAAARTEPSDARCAEASKTGPQRWGILEASQRISAVRRASHARTKAMRERPQPPRDSEIRLSNRTIEARNLDDLLREEMK